MHTLSEHHGRFYVIKGLILKIVVLCLIAISQVAAGQTRPRTVTDSEILPVILKAALSGNPQGDLRVDPRPLIPDASYQYEIQPEAFASVSQSVIDKRGAIVRATGLTVVGTALVNQTNNCPGTLVAGQPDSLAGVDNKRRLGCPQKPFDILTVGPPRPGRISIPTDQVYDRSGETAACGYWAVRVIRTTLGHGRSSTFAADYVLTQRGGEWVVVKTVGLMYSH
jgi:hypothetical protein